jgi:putative tricarboxylic transport membrane protein
MKTRRIVPCLCWIALSLFVLIFSYRMGLGGVHSPGPGLMPFLLGVLLLFPSFYLIAEPLLRKREERTALEKTGRGNYRKRGLVLVSLVLFCLLLERLGYLLSMFLFSLALFRIMNNGWRTVLIGSVLTILVTYYGFTFLGLKLPEGIFR